MLRKLSVLFIACFIIAGFYGCASIPGPITEPKELKLKWNISYVQGLVMVKEALKTGQIKFEKAVIGKHTAELKGNFADGRTVQIIISKISNTESSVVAHVANSQTPKEDSKEILEAIMRYSNKKK
ncbi:MAG: hypothetical protein KKC39_04625 [Candidatus Omnitrophica bacterium]|nr:hypothetical protein [Candidatus Omnitrophota bacterium]MBU4303815.1 hypothetical protein [Candidatus Omnitrophota bacterium]MBU4418758.1 hypothetical protein [Candidatus Omnitrophota bacterium]MBU4468006.1 hypothetical protein [Candidatus Omnitrophota bacterium]MCG2707803.1 hypothetical protein [Candidatus Omnitrophota bacterium]